MAVGDDGIHGRQPRGRHVAGPTHLIRGWSRQKGRKPVAVIVAGEVEQHIDAVSTNHFGQGAIIEVADVAPSPSRRTKTLRIDIVFRLICVADDFGQIFGGQGLDNANSEVSHGMPPEIARDEAQARWSAATSARVMPERNWRP